MSTHNDYSQLARSIYDAYNRRDFDYPMSLCAGDLVWTNVPTGETLHGPEGFRQDLENWATAFPDSKVEISNVISSGDCVCVEFVGRGTHNGLLSGPAGQIPPTGRHIEVRFCDVLCFRDGKIASGHTYFDMVTIMSQLGLMPQQKAA